MSRSLRLKNEKESIPSYLRLLYKEMDDFSPIVANLEVTTLYFGGGTPSLLTADQIQSLFKNLKKRFFISPHTRIIFEASPFTLNEKKLNILKNYNVHELDLGVQSLDNEVLRKNGRPQTISQTITVIKYAKKIGIPSVAIDLMVGLPYQTIDSAIMSVTKAVHIAVDGIYINPFLPLPWTRFHREGNIYSFDQANSRDRARNIIDKLLVKMHYRRTESGYRKKWTVEDQERAYHSQEADNLLSFGHGAFSHTVASLKYYEFISVAKKSYHEMLPKMLNARLEQKSAFQYYGLEMDSSKEMYVFAFTYIHDLSMIAFKNRFKKDFRQVFKKQLEILTSNNLVTIHNDRIILSTRDSFTQKFIRTFFIEPSYIEKLKIFEREEYDPRKNYRFLAQPFMQ